MEINLTTGTLDTNDNMDGWIITSENASYIFNPDYDELTVYMHRGDTIDIDGNVRQNNVFIANIG